MFSVAASSLVHALPGRNSRLDVFGHAHSYLISTANRESSDECSEAGPEV